MRLREINKLKLEDFYWRILSGRSSRRSSFFELRASGFRDLPPPVFFLSTGRCGTNWFTMLLAHDNSVMSFHEPRPNFGVQGKVAYEVYSRLGLLPGEMPERLLEEIFLTGREQYLRYSFKTRRRLVETNNQATFLAPAIHRLFPETRFVHLNRHPAEFVRSAMRRNFYNNTDDIKRIVPVEGDPLHSGWNDLSLLEKNCWLWDATNAFIDRFKDSLPAGNHMYFDFNRLDEENIGALCSFLDVRIPRHVIRRMLNRRVNAQQTGNYEGYGTWPEHDRETLRRICGGRAAEYGYQL